MELVRNVSAKRKHEHANTSTIHNHSNCIKMTMMKSFTVALLAALLLASLDKVHGFVSQSSSRHSTAVFAEPKKGFFANFFEELDAFVDDATSRRLGAGAAFYGKRKSNFYGENDKGRKQDRDMPDPTEDYQAPAQGGYFKWMQDDETGQMKPVTRMKGKVVERNPNYWDKVYGADKEE